MCTMLTERMRNAGRAASVRHLSFPQARHALFLGPSQEAPGPMRLDFGGTDDSANVAHLTAWPQVLEHLRA